MLALVGILLILIGWERCAKGASDDEKDPSRFTPGFNIMTGIYAIGAGIACGIAYYCPP